MRSDYCIGEGGLLRRLEIATRLTRWRTQVVAVVGFLWLPVVLLSLFEWARGMREPLIQDMGFHVRLLLATPIFLWLDGAFPLVCKQALVQLHSQGFVPGLAGARVNRILETAARTADSDFPEIVLAILGLSLGVMALIGSVHIFGLGMITARSPAQVWYALVDLPLFQFLLWRSLWRWLVWAGMLVALSRVELDLVSTHPDRRGGLSFLRLPSLAYCAVLLFAVSGVLCAEWGRRFTFGATVESYAPILLLFGTAGSVIAFGPLLGFGPQLYRARRRGLLEVEGLASSQGRRFRERWIIGAFGAPDPLHLRGELQAISDTGNTYRETVQRLSPFLFDVKDVVLLLAATLLPVVPAMLFHVPNEDWIAIVGIVSGGWAR